MDPGGKKSGKPQDAPRQTEAIVHQAQFLSPGFQPKTASGKSEPV
jgi:hypothetical protein